MVAFALRWAPYGGGDEHILPEFGVQPPEFYRRLASYIASGAAGIDSNSHTTLSVLCRRKLEKTGNLRRQQ